MWRGHSQGREFFEVFEGTSGPSVRAVVGGQQLIHLVDGTLSLSRLLRSLPGEASGAVSSERSLRYRVRPVTASIKKCGWRGFLQLPSAYRLRTQVFISLRNRLYQSGRVRPVRLRGRQGRVAAPCRRWAQEYWASVCGGNRLNARCEEGAYHSYRQNRNPDCQLCIHFLHCRAPLGSWDILALAFRRK
jgi:hypothetical protein